MGNSATASAVAHLNSLLFCFLLPSTNHQFQAFMETIELKVEMVGFHYEKRIKKCLSKLRGVEKVEVEFSKKKVVVRGEAGERRVVKALRRSGFRSEPWCSKTEMLLAYFSSSHKPLLRL